MFNKTFFVASVCSLALILFPGAALAQGTVAAEVIASVEAELESSAEAAKELSVDLKAELDFPQDYNPVVPKGFFGNIGYAFKNVARNTQRVAVKTFGSDAAYANIT